MIRFGRDKALPVVLSGAACVATLTLATVAGADTAVPRDASTVERVAWARASEGSAAAKTATYSLPALGEIVALARDRSPEVVVGRADVAVARSGMRGARLSSFENPSFALLFDRGALNVTRDVTVSGSLVVPVEVSGQRQTRIAEVEALVEWQSAGLEASKAHAAGEAARAYGEVVVAAERARTFQGIVEVARNEADVYSARLESGDATEQDEKLSRVELAKNNVILAESRADLTHALFALERAVGARYVVDASTKVEPPPPGARSRTAFPDPLSKVSEKEATFHARAKDRAARDGFAPLELIFTAGRGDLGEARFGGGVGWTFPIARRNQAEQARADASRVRANVEKEVRSRVVASTIDGLLAERNEVRDARELLVTEAKPAALAAIDAALETQRAGKGELLRVLTARRDLAILELRRLELLAREWEILSDVVLLTGELP